MATATAPRTTERTGDEDVDVLGGEEVGERFRLRVACVVELRIGGRALLHLDPVGEPVANEKQLHRRTNVVP